MEKIVPMDTLTSMLDDPSRGSMAITYLPSFCRSVKDSVSSEMMAQASPPFVSARVNRMLASTPSFCCCSPVVFTDPTGPMMSINQALFTSLFTTFEASARSRSSCDSSPLTYGNWPWLFFMIRSGAVPMGMAILDCSILVELRLTVDLYHDYTQFPPMGVPHTFS